MGLIFSKISKGLFVINTVRQPKCVSVNVISLSWSQSDPIKRCLLYFHFDTHSVNKQSKSIKREKNIPLVHWVLMIINFPDIVCFKKNSLFINFILFSEIPTQILQRFSVFLKVIDCSNLFHFKMFSFFHFDLVYMTGGYQIEFHQIEYIDQMFL